MSPRKRPRGIRFRIILADHNATIDVTADILSDLRLAMADQPSPQRDAARDRIIQNHIIPQLHRQGEMVTNVNWIDGPSGIFPVIGSIEAEGQVTRRHGITDDGVPSCNCPDRCPIPGHDHRIY